MGATTIPEQHEEAVQFVPRVLTAGQRSFDLALCDGQVLRPVLHTRASYREARENDRLSWVQLGLGLSHLKEGGTMIVLLHNVEAWRNVQLLYLFSKISRMKLFKPSRAHAARGSFYMVASDIRVSCTEAVEAVERWKTLWRAATFGTEEELDKIAEDGSTPEELLAGFGDTVVELGTQIWKIQGDALAEKLKNGWK